MTDAPCKGCAARHPACHDSCEAYRTFKQGKDAARIAEQEEQKWAISGVRSQIRSEKFRKRGRL